MSKPVLILRDLGRIGYNQALQIQNNTCRQLLDCISGKKLYNNVLLLCEHFPIYTLGIRNKLYSESEEKYLKSLGADFIRTNRGGLITFHGPGQLVAYPVLFLGDFHPKKSMKWYIGQLEQCCINICEKFDLRATTTKDTGVWIGERKIAAIGVHGSRYVTTHGFALNCNVDLEWFKHIVPCGIPDKEVTSLSKELGYEITVNEVKLLLKNVFEETFQCDLVNYS